MRTRIVTEGFRGEVRAGREERVVNFKDGEHGAKKGMKMPIGQECFCDYKISWIQVDVAYQKGKTGLEQTMEEGPGKPEKFRLEEKKNRVS